MNEENRRNLEKYIDSLPWLGLIISIILMILYFVIFRVREDVLVVFLYCLMPLFVNISVYVLSLCFKEK